MEQTLERKSMHESTRGRRRIAPQFQRTNNRSTKFNDAELSVVESLASRAELTVSDYLRSCAINSFDSSCDKQLQRDAIKSLGIASSAVNKLSDKAHGRGGAIGKAECAELVQALIELTDAMTEVRNSL